MPSFHLNALPNQNVCALAYESLCTFEFAIAVEIFGLPRPELGPRWYRFSVANVDEGPVRATGGIRLEVDGGLELLEQAGTIVIPGWRSVDAPVPAALCEALSRAHERGARILSICSGVYVLAHAGLLDGRRATTHWRYTRHLETAFASRNIDVVPEVLYVDEGDILSSAGSAAGIDLCLHLVRRDHGPEVANHVARRLVVPPHRDGGQAQYVESPIDSRSGSNPIAELLAWIRTQLREDLSIARLADRANLSERTLVRRFVAATGEAPGRWITNERLRQARDLLEGTRWPVEQVAQRCGFGSAATLRHHFRERFDVSPTAYRNRFTREH